MQFYILTSGNLKALKRHFDSEYSGFKKKDAVVIINSLNEDYIKEAVSYCTKKKIEHHVTESNGTPAKGKNSLLEAFLASDNDYCVMIDGDDFLTPHGVWMYKHLAGLETPPDAVCLINQRSIKKINHKPYSVKPFTVDYENLLTLNYLHVFNELRGLSIPKATYYSTLYNNYYTEQRKYSEGDEIHCRVTWVSRKAASFKFNEELIIGEDTLHMLRLKHEALEGRLNFHTNDEQPATYIYDERTPGTVEKTSKFGIDYEWMNDYLVALEEMEKKNYLHENTRLPELKIDYPKDYVYDDYDLTSEYTHKVDNEYITFPKNATDTAVKKCHKFLESLENQQAAQRRNTLMRKKTQSKEMKALRALKKLKNYRAMAYAGSEVYTGSSGQNYGNGGGGGGVVNEVLTTAQPIPAQTYNTSASAFTNSSASYGGSTSGSSGTSYGGGSGSSVTTGKVEDTAEGIEEEEVEVKETEITEADLVKSESGLYLVRDTYVNEEGNTVAAEYSIHPEHGKTQAQLDATDRAQEYKNNLAAAEAADYAEQRRLTDAENKISPEDNADVQEVVNTMANTGDNAVHPRDQDGPVDSTGGGTVTDGSTGAVNTNTAGAPTDIEQTNPTYVAPEMEAASILKAVPEIDQRADAYAAANPEWDETQSAEAKAWFKKAQENIKLGISGPEMPAWLVPDFRKGYSEALALEIDESKTVAPEGTTTDVRNIEKLDDAGTTSAGTVDAPASVGYSSQKAPTKVKAPTGMEGQTYTAARAGYATDVTAAQATVSADAEANLDDAKLTEKAKAAKRDPAEEQKALADDKIVFSPSEKAYVDTVTGKRATLEQTEAAEKKERALITDATMSERDAAKIKDIAGFDAAQRRTVKGTAAKSSAAEMLTAVAEMPPEIAAAIVEDPATVEIALDKEPVEVRAAIAALPTEALVSSQIESLLGGMEDGNVPLWAKPAVSQVEQMLAKRGMTASTIGRDALFNAIIQSAMPIAQSNAQALQSRAAQNLSNQQQANMSTATLDMQRRLANLSNEQTSYSQTAQMAQQMSTLQSQFRQDAVMTTAQQQQQTRTQDLANRQETAKVNAMNDQAMRAQNLGNEQQVELAEMQYMNATESENMSAVQQKRMAEFQVAADFMSKNAGFVQQMNLANLSAEQQTKLANLTSQNQAASETLSNEQATELANLNTKMQTNLLQGKIAAEMNQAQLTADQQRAVQNASMVAGVDMSKFSAAQQVELTNSKFMQTMVATKFTADQQAAMQNATAMATLDMANLDKNAKLAAQNAQAFLQMDMTNLSNEQQANVMKAQNQQQVLLSDTAAKNASLQFGAANEQQTQQFMASLGVQVEQYNSSSNAAREQFNATAKDRAAAIDAGNELQAASLQAQLDTDVAKFNEQQDFNRDQWNAANAQAVEQSNVQWRRQANLSDTAAQNSANQQNAQISYNLTSQEQTQLWQQLRDEAAYIRQNFENEQQRKAQLLATAIGNEKVGSRKATEATEWLKAVSDVL